MRRSSSTRRANIVHRQHVAVDEAERPLKIVVTGPFNAGKTTLIRTISDVAIVGTEREVTDATRAVKASTTVAMDFGRISFDGANLYIFGTPGQRRFETLWEILSEGMLGFVLLVNAADERSADEASHILQTFREFADVPFAVGVSHLDRTAVEPGAVLARVRASLRLGDEVSVFACDPRVKHDVKVMLLDILEGVRARLQRAEERRR